MKQYFLHKLGFGLPQKVNTGCQACSQQSTEVTSYHFSLEQLGSRRYKKKKSLPNLGKENGRGIKLSGKFKRGFEMRILGDPVGSSPVF